MLPLSQSANRLTLKQSQFLVRVQNEGAGKSLRHRNRFLSELLLLQRYQTIKEEVWKTFDRPQSGAQKS